jgi:hypothetical protein
MGRAGRTKMTSNAERLDENAMLEGFSWREAACLVNEQLNTLNTIYGRCQLAADMERRSL